MVAPAFADIDEAVFSWFTEQRANKVPLSVKVLQQKAVDFACLLGHENFRASAGWLNRFEARHDIVAKVISRESASVDSSEMSSWLQSTQEIRDQYKPEDTYNADETALF